jgi:hypothetical protein
LPGALRDDHLAAGESLLLGTHDITAARELVLPGLRPWLKIFPCLADSGYEGAGAASSSR